MEDGHSWEADSCSANQEIPKLLWNLQAHYCVHRNLPPVSTLLSNLVP
jgi:hypothetical protein